MQNDWKKCYIQAERLLEKRGIDNRHLILTLFCMIYLGCPYSVALKFYSEYRDEAPERMQSNFCFWLLREGREIHPEQLLTELAKEAEDENGVSAAKRG